MKFKNTRLFAQTVISFFRGWKGRFHLIKGEDAEISNWITLFDYQMIIRFRDELGEYNRNRITNMILCCKLIDNIIVKPRQIFSLQNIIGEPSIQKGFAIGPTIINGKLEMDSGGGICQISTALFNAALMCNLRILEKHNHSSDIWGEKRIVDLGLDATYSYGRLDLKFENNFAREIAIKIKVDEAQHLLKCSILSPIMTDWEVKVESKILRELFPQIGKKRIAGSESIRNGWIVQTRRFVTENKNHKYITYEKTEKYRPLILPARREQH